MTEKEEIRSMVSTIVSQELNKILRMENQNIKQGIVVDVNSKTRTARIQLQGENQSDQPWIRYSNTIAVTGIKPGDLCILLSPDTSNITNAYIVACFGNVEDQGTSEIFFRASLQLVNGLQTINDNTDTAVELTNVEHDTAEAFDSSSFLYTVPRTGWYNMQCALRWAGPGAGVGRFACLIRRTFASDPTVSENLCVDMSHSALAAKDLMNTASDQHYLAQGDTLQLMATQNGGSSETLEEVGVVSGNGCWMSLRFVSP